MGLDVGSKTVGVAVSDQLGWTAQGVEIVRINEDEEIFGLDRVVELAKEKQVVGFVIGLPKNMNNTCGPRVEAAQKYGKMLQAKINLPIDFQDHYLQQRLLHRVEPCCHVNQNQRIIILIHHHFYHRILQAY